MLMHPPPPPDSPPPPSLRTLIHTPPPPAPTSSASEGKGKGKGKRKRNEKKGLCRPVVEFRQLYGGMVQFGLCVGVYRDELAAWGTGADPCVCDTNTVLIRLGQLEEMIGQAQAVIARSMCTYSAKLHQKSGHSSDTDVAYCPPVSALNLLFHVVQRRVILVDTEGSPTYISLLREESQSAFSSTERSARRFVTNAFELLDDWVRTIAWQVNCVNSQYLDLGGERDRLKAAIGEYTEDEGDDFNKENVDPTATWRRSRESHQEWMIRKEGEGEGEGEGKDTDGTWKWLKALGTWCQGGGRLDT